MPHISEHSKKNIRERHYKRHRENVPSSFHIKFVFLVVHLNRAVLDVDVVALFIVDVYPVPADVDLFLAVLDVNTL